jgi:hypothetical protein
MEHNKKIYVRFKFLEVTNLAQKYNQNSFVRLLG